MGWVVDARFLRRSVALGGQLRPGEAGRVEGVVVGGEIDVVVGDEGGLVGDGVGGPWFWGDCGHGGQGCRRLRRREVERTGKGGIN